MSEPNRWWDERVPLHVASDFYDVDGFKAGASTLRDFELEEVGDVTPRLPLVYSPRAGAQGA